MYEEPKNGQYRYAWGVLQARLEDAARTRQWRSPETVLAWMDDAEQLALVVHNTCPFCRAEPGDLCHDLAGMATYSPHPERCGERGNSVARSAASAPLRHTYSTPRYPSRFPWSSADRLETRYNRTPDSEITDGEVKS